MHLNASAAQIGYAARMRTKVHGNDRKTLNYIVHSPDTYQRYGPNPFTNNKLFDEKAQAALERIAKAHNFTEIASDLKLAAFYYRIKQLLNRKTEDKTSVLREIEEMVDDFQKKQDEKK